MSSKGRQVHVKAAAGQAPWAVLFCPRCPNTMSSGYEQDFKYQWSLKLKCFSCQTSWWVCRLCASQRTHLSENSQLSRHHRKFHKGDVAAVPSAEPQPEPAVNSPARQEIFSLTSFGRKASQEYFRASSTGNGPRYLIAKALGQESTMSNLDGDDIDMMMSLAHFVTTLTRNQRDLVAEVLSKSIEATRRQYEMEMQTKITGKAPSQQSIPVPTTKQQLRSIICKGKRSLILNLPHPEVRTLNDHAYVLPSECVADLLAHGTVDFNHGRTIHQVESLAESRLAKEIIEKNDQFQCKSIFLSFWSDDFEPNYSKGNRGSVWICTLTVQTANSGTPRINNVYPLAVGPKGSCHQSVVHLLLDDMKKMERLEGNASSLVMYDGKTKSDVQVSAHLLCVTQDQPERRGFNGLLLGGKAFHARWGWSFNVSDVRLKMPPCATCLSELKKTKRGITVELRICDECFNFWSSPREMNHEAENDYPDSELDDDIDLLGVTSKTLKCQKLSFSILKDVAKRAHEKIVAGQWTKSTARAFLSRFCLNTQSQDELIQCASNSATYKKAQEENNVEVIAACDALMVEEPEKHGKWKYPAMWDSGITVQQVTEPCMHLLFLGLMKNNCFQIQEWAAMRNQYSAMRRELEKRTVVLEELHLGWCKIQPYRGEKLGGWVSENFMAFARVAPWVYSCLHTLDDDPPLHPQDGKPISRWTADECKNFLRPRRIMLTGNVKDLRQRVQENFDLPIPPPVGGPVEEVDALIVSQWEMNCFFMGMENLPEDDSAKKMGNCLIRLFLNALAVHDSSTGPVAGRKLPIWVTQYNCQSLLNLPDQTEMLGPIRNRWEGGKRGEGFLRVVKPIVQSGRKNWQKNLFSNILRQKTLVQMKATNDDDDVSECDDDDSSMEECQIHEPQSFVNYRCHAEVVEKWTRGTVLSGVMVDGRVFICHRYGARSLLLEFKTTEDSAVFSYGLWYYYLQYSDVEDESKGSLQDARVESYALLLPMLTSNATQKYALVTSNWRTWDGTGKVVEPYTMHNDSLVV
jgi:hypothetical protein